MRSIETLVRSGKLRHGLLLAACMMFVSASSAPHHQPREAPGVSGTSSLPVSGYRPDCGACNDYPEDDQHEFVGGFDGWFCRLLEAPELNQPATWTGETDGFEPTTQRN
ncbi:MAG: hypothetical protein ACREMA_06525 [Longimicrobiales bacterium]